MSFTSAVLTLSSLALAPTPLTFLPPLLPGLGVYAISRKAFPDTKVWGKGSSSMLPETTRLLLPGHQSHRWVCYLLGLQTIPRQSLQDPLILAVSAKCEGFNRYWLTQ